MATQNPVPENATLAPDLPEGMSDVERYTAERDHWRHMFDQLASEFPEPVIVVDDEGRLTPWNEEQASFVGFSAAEALGREAHEVIGTEDVTETLAEGVAELAAANQQRTDQVEEISRSVGALERNLNSAIGDD